MKTLQFLFCRSGFLLYFSSLKWCFLLFLLWKKIIFAAVLNRWKVTFTNWILSIVSFNKPELAKENYAKRWQIETCFRAMKTSGFNVEKTHLNQIDRVEKLLLLVMIALVWCYKVGIHLNEQVRKIVVNNHGRKAKSIFKYGLDYICQVLLSPNNKEKRIEIFKFLSCT